MFFKPDTSNQAQEMLFSRKKSVTNNGTIYSSNMPIVKENMSKVAEVRQDKHL